MFSLGGVLLLLWSWMVYAEEPTAVSPDVSPVVANSVAVNPVAVNPTVELRITAYDSLLTKKGALALILPDFEKECGCRVRAMASGDAAHMVSRMELDAKRGKPSVHVGVGVDLVLWDRVKNLAEPWGTWKPKGWAGLDPELWGKDKDFLPKDFLPVDQGVFAWIADTQALNKKKLEIPHSILDVLKPEWKRNLILEDPRTSSPGLSFLLYTNKILKGREWEKYWREFMSQWLTLAPGWDAGYGLFLKGEAPLVWSYVTSQAYHREHGDSDKRYQAVILDEGNPVQIEGAWIVKGAIQNEAERAAARLFLEFLIRPEIQARIAHANWMMPVVKGVLLPDSFRDLPKLKTRILLKSISQQVSEILDRWNKIVSAP